MPMYPCMSHCYALPVSGKKGKKTKGKTLNLNEFLHAPGSGGGGGNDGDFTTVVAAPKSSWADEMEEYEDSPRYSSSSRGGGPSAETIVLPTAPRAARTNEVDEDRVPLTGPYTTYIANLPYDIEADDILEFFRPLSVSQGFIPSICNRLLYRSYFSIRSAMCACPETATPRTGV